MAGAALELGLRAGATASTMQAETINVFFSAARRSRLRMDTCAEEKSAEWTITLGGSHDWVHRLLNLLDAAMQQLYYRERTAHGIILKAASLLRQQIDPPSRCKEPNGTGRLLAWQVRKLRDYIDSHITEPVLVADLCALVHLSEAHFSRSFRRTFGDSPHSSIVRRRLQLAAQYMLTTNASLSDIALRCGFADHAHFCKRFRKAAAQSPAAWRRAQHEATQSLMPALELTRDLTDSCSPTGTCASQWSESMLHKQQL